MGEGEREGGRKRGKERERKRGRRRWKGGGSYCDAHFLCTANPKVFAAICTCVCVYLHRWRWSKNKEMPEVSRKFSCKLMTPGITAIISTKAMRKVWI